MTSYSVDLYDCPISADAKEQAAKAFCAAIEKSLGGPEGVVAAHKAYTAAFESYEELPLPSSATDAERKAVARWEEAENAGNEAAFRDFKADLGGAHFEIEY